MPNIPRKEPYNTSQTGPKVHKIQTRPRHAVGSVAPPHSSGYSAPSDGSARYTASLKRVSSDAASPSDNSTKHMMTQKNTINRPRPASTEGDVLIRRRNSPENPLPRQAASSQAQPVKPRQAKSRQVSFRQEAPKAYTPDIPARVPFPQPRGPFPQSETPGQPLSPREHINKKKALLVAVAVSAMVVAITAMALVFNPFDDRYSIGINGQTDIILANEEEAQAVLEELMAYHRDRSGSDTFSVSAVSFEEDVKVVKINAAASKVKTKDEALQALIHGRPQTLDYAVAAGETIQAIAQKHDITEDSIIAGNGSLAHDALPKEGVSSEEDAASEEDIPLTEGTTIQLVVAQPYLHVIVEGVSEISEEIDFTTETKKDGRMILNTSKVQQQGEKGARDITCSLVLKNGVEVERAVLEEVVTKEPVAKIVVEGSKPLRLPGVSRTPNGSGISEYDMLQSMISHESGGRVNAISPNGQYKGVGQLMEMHYQNNVGMSYAETLAQPDPYAVQVEAMLGYIYGRYGSIEAAYGFRQQKNWY